MSDSINFKNSELLNIFYVLSNMRGNYPNKLKYAIKRNKDILVKVVRDIEDKSNTKIEKLSEYEAKRIDLIKKYAARNDKGEVIQESRDTVKIQEDKLDEFKDIVNKLNEEYKVELEQRRTELENYNKYLEEEVSLELYNISNDLIPEKLTQDEYEIIFPLIKD